MAERIPDIDVVRGFAITGLPVINLGLTVGKSHYPVPGPISSVIYHDLFLHRFVTIFCFLFGLSFALVLRAAAERAPRPRLVLARRLAMLLAFGIFQLFLLDGNLQLVVYATLGLVLLLPASYLPRRVVLALATGLLFVSVPFADSGVGEAVKILAITSGLLLLGATVVNYRIQDELPRHTAAIRTVFLIAAALAIVANVLHSDTVTVSGSAVGEVAMLATSVAYVTGLLLLLRTRARRALVAALAPLGRMALTNFLVQAAAAVAFAAAFDVAGWNYSAVTFGCTEAFVVAQAVFCAWWLRRFRYGPCEWLWRCATWLTLVPMRRPVRVPR